MNTITLYHWQYRWLTFRSIWSVLEHQHNLTNLIQWAKRKRLTSPRKLYEWKLQEVEVRLCNYRLRDPQKLVMCEWLYAAYQMITEPSYYKKGSAARYRSC